MITKNNKTGAPLVREDNVGLQIYALFKKQKAPNHIAISRRLCLLSQSARRLYYLFY
jgi:hypothetical protein